MAVDDLKRIESRTQFAAGVGRAHGIVSKAEATAGEIGFRAAAIRGAGAPPPL
ncbi:MAG: hypothetical protein WA177_08925 [Xanthobacteraceae bacterium]